MEQYILDNQARFLETVHSKIEEKCRRRKVEMVTPATPYPGENVTHEPRFIDELVMASIHPRPNQFHELLEELVDLEDSRFFFRTYLGKIYVLTPNCEWDTF